MAPTLVQHTFGGRGCGAGVSGEMADRLSRVESRLREIHAGSEPDTPFEAWCGFNEPHIGYRAGAGRHGLGQAIDVNVTTNPYIVTRTGNTLGGEAAAADQLDMRRRAIEVCDRAVQFTLSSDDRADLSIRVNDTIEATYDRFRLVSDCLSFYLLTVFSMDHVRVTRPPIPNVHALFDGDPEFGKIDPSEIVLERQEAVESLEVVMGSSDWRSKHPGWGTPEQQYWQILRDYELVRIPMLHGSPKKPIVATRNPTRGFLDLRREVVVELVRTGGMRWGASDFKARASGDIMHFDFG